MARFVTRTVAVEAWLIGDLIDTAQRNWRALPESVRDAYERGGLILARDFINVRTAVGWGVGERDGWLVLRAGRLAPMTPAAFRAAYKRG